MRPSETGSGVRESLAVRLGIFTPSELIEHWKRNGIGPWVCCYGSGANTSYEKFGSGSAVESAKFCGADPIQCDARAG